MKQILSVGKTIKIVRFLENTSINLKDAQFKDLMDHQGIDIGSLAS